METAPANWLQRMLMTPRRIYKSIEFAVAFLAKKNNAISAKAHALENGCALIRLQNSYLAIAVARIEVEKSIESSRLAKALENLPYDFDYIVRIRQVDAKRFVEGLEVKKRLKEIALSKSKSYEKQNALRREIEAIESEISALMASKPKDISIYIKALAESASPYAASEEAMKNLQIIADSITSLGEASYEVLKGKKALEWVNDPY